MTITDAEDPIEQAITEYWGERCPDYSEGCPCCAVWAHYDALLAASQARALSSGEGWQDIATAPKDGELLLLCMTPHDGYLHAPMKVGGWWNSRWNIFGGSWKPTHWQPLPQPPSKDNTK